MYSPISTAPNSARAGVRSRLVYALLASAATFACAFGVIFVAQAPFAAAALSIVGFCTFSLSIAMILSARREETVHQLATAPEVPMLDDHGYDGYVDV